MRQWFRSNLDLLACVAAAAAGLAFQLLPAQPLRLVVGLAMVLFVPGYACMAALFGGDATLDRPARLSLSIGLSLALLPLISLALNALPWGLRPWPIALSLFAVTTLFSLLALARRWRREPPAVGNALGAAGRPGRWLAFGATGLVAAALALTLLTLRQPDRSSETLEFYALGSAGLAEDYPRAVAPGQPFPVTVGVNNRTAAAERVRIQASGPAGALASLGPLEVAPGARVEQPLTMTLALPADDQLITIELFRADEPAPVRRLELRLDVRGAAAP